MPNALRHQVTSIVSVTGNPGTQQERVTALELVPFREELFRADDLDTPQKVARALHLIQRHVSEATKATRSLPVLGGSYWPNVAIPANTTIAIPHGLGATVALLPVDVRVKAGAAPAEITDAGQSPDGNILYVRTTTACTVDLWVFPKPVAAGRGSAVPSFGAPAQTTTPSGLVAVSQLAPGLDGQYLVTGFVGSTTPDQISGLSLWLRSDTVVLSGSNVSQWTDKSGNGNHAVQATGANQPLYNASDRAFNFQPSLQFDGFATFLEIATTVGLSPQPLTVYVVGFMRALPNTPRVISHLGGFEINGGGAPVQYRFADGSGTTLTGTFAGTTPHIFAITLGGASGGNVWYTDNSDTPTATSTFNGTGALGSPVYIGTSNGSTASVMNGKLCEIIAYSGLHTQAQRRQILQYLAGRYGISVTGPNLTAEWLYPQGDTTMSASTPGLVTVTGIQGTGVSTVAPNTGATFVFNGTLYVPEQYWGDIRVATSARVTVAAIQGTDVSSAAPAQGNLLAYNRGFSPPDLGSLTLWVRSDNVTIDSNGNVSTWADKSGNGNDLTQATAALRPGFVGEDSTFNGYPSLSFSLANATYLTHAAFTLAAPYTVYIVASAQAGQPANAFIIDGTNPVLQAINSPSNFRASVTAGLNNMSSGVALGPPPHIIAWQDTGSAGNLYVDSNTVLVSDAHTGSGFTGGLFVGTKHNALTTTAFNGQIAEILIFAANHTGAQIAQVMGYLSARYNLAVTGGTAPGFTGWQPIAGLDGDVGLASTGIATVKGLQRTPVAPIVPTSGQELVAAPFDPTAIGGNGVTLLAWYRADKGVTQSGTVSQWNDSSGSGDSNRNATQGTGALQPTFQATNASYNNQPTITFSPAGSFMATGTWSVARTQPITVFVVGNVSGTGNRYVFDALPADGAHQAIYSKGTTTAINAGTELASATAITSPSVICGVFNNLYSSLAIGNVAPSASGVAGTDGATGLVIGNYYGEASGTELGGPIAEIIVYAGILDPPDLLRVMGYLANRYALTATGSVVPTTMWAPGAADSGTPTSTTYLSNGTFTPTVTGLYMMEGCGGGGSGGGGGSSATTGVGATGAAGGGGSLKERSFAFLTAGVGYTVTIGAGGASAAGGTSGNQGTVGNDGGDTTVTHSGITYASFLGGQGGMAGAAAASSPNNVGMGWGGASNRKTQRNTEGASGVNFRHYNPPHYGGQGAQATNNAQAPGSDSEDGQFTGGSAGTNGSPGGTGAGGGGAGPYGNGVGGGNGGVNDSSAGGNGNSASANTGAGGGGGGGGGAHESGGSGGAGGSGQITIYGPL